MKIYLIFAKFLFAIGVGSLIAIAIFQKKISDSYEEAKQQEKLNKEEQYVTQAFEISNKINDNLDKNKYFDANLLNEKLQKVPVETFLKAGALLSLAKYASEHNETSEAERKLIAVLSLDGNDEFKVTARLRLAGIYLDTKQYDEGLKILDYPEQNLNSKLSSLIHDRKGDIFFEKNDFSNSLQEYTIALSKLGVDDQIRELILLKIDALKKNDVRQISN